MKEPPKETSQYLILGVPRCKIRENKLPEFGDWKERKANPKTAMELAHAVLDTHKENRIADRIVIRFEDGEEFSFLSREFQNRIHHAFPQANAPQMTPKAWAKILTK